MGYRIGKRKRAEVFINNLLALNWSKSISCECRPGFTHMQWEMILTLVSILPDYYNDFVTR